MKNLKINALGLALIIGLCAFRVASSDDEVTTRTKLTTEQMSLIDGKGCPWWKWLLVVAEGVECAQGNIIACVGYAAGIAECGENNGGGGGTGEPCDPCPNGGGVEEYGGCQQMGGQPSGQPGCSYGSNMTCCIYP